MKDTCKGVNIVAPMEGTEYLGYFEFQLAGSETVTPPTEGSPDFGKIMSCGNPEDVSATQAESVGWCGKGEIVGTVSAQHLYIQACYQKDEPNFYFNVGAMSYMSIDPTTDWPSQVSHVTNPELAAAIASCAMLGGAIAAATGDLGAKGGMSGSNLLELVGNLVMSQWSLLINASPLPPWENSPFSAGSLITAGCEMRFGYFPGNLLKTVTPMQFSMTYTQAAVLSVSGGPLFTGYLFVGEAYDISFEGLNQFKSNLQAKSATPPVWTDPTPDVTPIENPCMACQALVSPDCKGTFKQECQKQDEIVAKEVCLYTMKELQSQFKIQASSRFTFRRGKKDAQKERLAIGMFTHLAADGTEDTPLNICKSGEVPLVLLRSGRREHAIPRLQNR